MSIPVNEYLVQCNRDVDMKLTLQEKLGYFQRGKVYAVVFGKARDFCADPR